MPAAAQDEKKSGGEPSQDVPSINQLPKLDVEPNEIFKRMVLNDKKQNQRLSVSLSKSNGTKSIKKLPDDNSTADGKRQTRVRFVVCSLGLLALSLSQMSRMILNQTIKDMVDPAMHQGDNIVSSDGSCPWPEVLETTTPFDPILYLITTDKPESREETTTYYYEPPEDHLVQMLGGDDSDDYDISTPDEINSPTTSADILETTTSGQAIECPTSRFKWTMEQQSYLLGGFFYGYAFFMIPGGRLAEIYGAKYVVLLSVAGSGLINMATPWMARSNFTLLVLSRALMGVLQSGVFPAMYALFAKWLTATETSLFAPLIKVNLRLGMLMGSFLPGILPDWPSVYYYTSYMSAILSIIWFLVASSSPEGNSWVSEAELAHINRKKRKPEAIEMTTRTADSEEKHSRQVEVKVKTSDEPTPWLKILTNPSVIGLILVKVTFNYAVDFFSILIPSYLAYVHHADKKTVSFITTFMFSLQIGLIVFIGWLAKAMILKRPFGLSKTAIRKIFQALSNWGMAASLVLLTFNGCDLLYVGLLLQLMSLLSMFTAGGETMLPYDLSDQYPATIMAIANSVANFSGVTTTYLAGRILGSQSGSYSRWNLLMYLIAGANILGGLAFVLLIKAEPIDFSSQASPQKGGKDIERGDETATPSAPPAASTGAVQRPEMGAKLE